MKKILGLLVLVLLIGCQAEKGDFYFETVDGVDYFVNNSDRAIVVSAISISSYQIGNIGVGNDDDYTTHYHVLADISNISDEQILYRIGDEAIFTLQSKDRLPVEFHKFLGVEPDRVLTERSSYSLILATREKLIFFNYLNFYGDTNPETNRIGSFIVN